MLTVACLLATRALWHIYAFDKCICQRASSKPQRGFGQLPASRALKTTLTGYAITMCSALTHCTLASSTQMHTLWQARAHRKRGGGACGQRGLFGRLEDDGAARGQRWRHFASDHGEGEVPGCDCANNADGLMQGVGLSPGGCACQRVSTHPAWLARSTSVASTAPLLCCAKHVAPQRLCIIRPQSAAQGARWLMPADLDANGVANQASLWAKVNVRQRMQGA